MMKAKALATALDMVDGSVGTDDVVEIDGSIIRTTDDNWWTTVDAGEDLGESMVLPYSVLRAILKAFPDEGLVSLTKKYDNCVVKRELSAKESDLGQSQVVWRLNLVDVTLDKEPEFDDVEPVIGSGYDFLDAYKSLKHLMRPDLSRPGLMWGWTNEQSELVIGDGSRLGGRKCGISGLFIPNLVSTEIARILGLSMSEAVRWQVYEKHLRVTTKNTVFTCVLPKGARFESEFYDVVRGKAAQEPIVLKLSRSDLERAVKQVGVMAKGESAVKFTSGKGSLILQSKNERGEKCVAKIQAVGELKDPVTVNISHFESAIQSRQDELLTLKIAKSVVTLEDTTGWEIISRRMAQGM